MKLLPGNDLVHCNFLCMDLLFHIYERKRGERGERERERERELLTAGLIFELK